MEHPRPMQLAFACAAFAGAALSACQAEEGPPESSSPRPQITTTTSRGDYSKIKLPIRVPGTTTSSRPVKAAGANILGRVVDDRGQPVPGAFVRATYYRDADRPEVVETLTEADGSYRFRRVYGGRWRLSAWRPPSHARLKPTDFFLGASDQKKLDLRTKLVPDVAVTTATAPAPPSLGEPAELAVRIVRQQVGEEGRVERIRWAGIGATLFLPDGWRISRGGNPLGTDPAGEVRWELYCDLEGKTRGSVAVAGRTHVFPLTCHRPEPPAQPNAIPQ